MKKGYALLLFVSIFFSNGLASAYENFNTGYYYMDTFGQVGVSCPASVKVGSPLTIGVEPMILPLGKCNSSVSGYAALTFQNFAVIVRGFPYGAQGTTDAAVKTWGPFIKTIQPQVLSYPSCDHVVAVHGARASVTVINKVPAELANTAAIIRVVALSDEGAQLAEGSGCYTKVTN